MNEDKQRIKIAEACGWKMPGHPDHDAYFEGWSTADKWCLDPGGVDRFMHEIPIYTRDLNAMADAEFSGALEPVPANMELRHKYESELEITSQGHALYATAAQRAEAFLKTIGKWEEEPLVASDK